MRRAIMVGAAVLGLLFAVALWFQEELGLACGVAGLTLLDLWLLVSLERPHRRHRS